MAQSKSDSSDRFRQHHCRRRLCLLKGCGNCFRPRCALGRYCSEICRDAARRWSVKRAKERYRKSRKGKEKRREQNRVYRKRRKEREQVCDQSKSLEEIEGDHKKNNLDGIHCARPGCYERVAPTRRSPLKKYCSPLCRRAFQRVLERERRWRQRSRKLFEIVFRATLLSTI